MKSKIGLILLGVLLAHVALTIAENTEDDSLSEESSSYRLARAANADPGKTKAIKKNKKTKKVSKRNHKAKNAVKRNKKAQKVNRKNKKSNNARKKNKRKNKKTKKSRKNKRKNRKAKKVKKKNNKRKSKSQQAKKQKKNKKTKNNKKGKKSRKNKNKKSALRQPPKVPEQCLTEAVKTLYNGLSKKASYFERQVNRIEKYVTILTNKQDKAGDYNQAANNMKKIAPSCPNEILFWEAESLSVELGSCETNIKDNCTLPVYNKTQIEECKPVVEAFIDETEVCYNLTKEGKGTDACDCWQSEALLNLFADLSDCSIKESEKNVTEQFKKCKGAVSDCNKAQTDAFPVFVSCANNPVPGLEEEAELLANNINALSQAVTAVEEAAAPAKRRHIRSAATNCSDFIGLVEKLAELEPNSTEITSVAVDIVSSDVTCTAEEKLELEVQKAALDELIVEAEAALKVIQEELEKITGTTLETVTTPLPTEPATEPATVTTAAARMRMRGFVNQFKI